MQQSVRTLLAEYEKSTRKQPHAIRRARRPISKADTSPIRKQKL
jgi:hypothetical protein